MSTRDLWLTAIVAGMLVIGLNSTFPQDWTPTSAPSTNWVSVASSADGTRLVAAVSGGPIFTSTNSGMSWIPTSAPATNWNTVASSADGTVLVAAEYNYGIWVSTNSGSAWAAGASLPFPANDLRVATSADGVKIVACAWAPAQRTYLVSSIDSGSTWITTNSIGYYLRCVASSADGVKLVVGNTSGILASTNSGATWAYSYTPFGAAILSCSADGNKIAATAFGYGTWVSADTGVTWTYAGLIGGPVACSADGIKLITANADGIFTSADFGATWFTNDAPNLYWHAVASSADGCKLVAVVNGGGIYTREIMPTPTLTIAPSDNSFLISWVVPSVPFVLQECADLTTTNWTDVTTMPILNFTNLHHEVSVPLSSAYRFYRLKGL